MTIIEVLIILLIALFVTGIFSYAFKSEGSGSILFFFLIIFLASWAARLWILPIGPVFLGIAWIPVLIVGIIFAFILSAASSSPETAYKAIDQKRESQNSENIKTDEDRTSVAIRGLYLGPYYSFCSLLL